MSTLQAQFIDRMHGKLSGLQNSSVTPNTLRTIICGWCGHSGSIRIVHTNDGPKMYAEEQWHCFCDRCGTASSLQPAPALAVMAFLFLTGQADRSRDLDLSVLTTKPQPYRRKLALQTISSP
jgi:hypothetical protein